MHVQPHDSIDQLQEAARAEPRGRVRDRIRAVAARPVAGGGEAQAVTFQLKQRAY